MPALAALQRYMAMHSFGGVYVDLDMGAAPPPRATMERSLSGYSLVLSFWNDNRKERESG